MGTHWRMSKPMCRIHHMVEEVTRTSSMGRLASIGQPNEGQNFSFLVIVASHFEFEDEDMPPNFFNHFFNTLEDSCILDNISPLI